MSTRAAARVHRALGGEAPASGVKRAPMNLEAFDRMCKEAFPSDAILRATRSPICTVTVPVKTVSELNRHEHWRIRAKRAKAQHAAVTARCFHLGPIYREPGERQRMLKANLPLHVHLTRLSGRKLDTDNLAGALKHCRDAVAKFLGVDDGNEAAVSWSVGQERQKGYAVRVEFYRRGAEQQPRKSQTERPPGEDCRQLASADSSDLSNTSPRARVR